MGHPFFGFLSLASSSLADSIFEGLLFRSLLLNLGEEIVLEEEAERNQNRQSNEHELIYRSRLFP